MRDFTLKTTPQTAYEALPAAEKEKVDTVVFLQLLVMATPALNNPAQEGLSEVARQLAYTMQVSDAGLTRSVNPQATAVTEKVIEVIREQLAQSRVGMASAYEMHDRLQALSPELRRTLPNDMTKELDRLIAVDGDQYTREQLMRDVPAVPRFALGVQGFQR